MEVSSFQMNKELYSMENRIRLGVIGPTWMREVLEHCLKMFPSIQPIFRLSDVLEDANVFAIELQDEVDAYIFSGEVPYTLAKSNIPSGKPASFIPLKGTGLYQALYKLRTKTSFHHISFDGIASAYVEKVKNVLNENFSYNIYDGKPLLENVADMVHFHVRQFEKDEIAAVITCMKMVSEQLTEKGFQMNGLSLRKKML